MNGGHCELMEVSLDIAVSPNPGNLSQNIQAEEKQGKPRTPSGTEISNSVGDLRKLFYGRKK